MSMWLRGAFVSVALAAVALTPAVSLAHPTKPHTPLIYINSCGTKVAPKLWLFGCTNALGPLRQTEAYDLTYRHYGTGLALASGKMNVCLGPGSKVLAFCAEAAPAEVAYLSGPASLRFFDVVRCTSDAFSAPRLLYGKASFTLAGRPWETVTNPPTTYPGSPAESEHLKCHPVKLARR